jgi:hypothetical protein
MKRADPKLTHQRFLLHFIYIHLPAMMDSSGKGAPVSTLP